MKAISSQTNALRLASFITAANVLVASGFSIAGLISPASLLPVNWPPTEASFIFALYAAARTIPLTLIIFIAIYNRSTSALIVLGSLAGAVQFLDSGVGLYQHDLGKALGPLVICCLQFYAVFILRRSLQAKAAAR
jgi:hypothetical protein